MSEKLKHLPLRNGVGLVVLNNENKVFVAKRIDNPKNFWQMPQGGINKGEDYYTAALRELKEETSIVSVKPIKEIEEKLTYILPDHLIGIIWKGKYKGQKQKWFIMKFIGNDSEINIKTINALPFIKSPLLAKNFLFSESFLPLVETISPFSRK